MTENLEVLGEWISVYKESLGAAKGGDLDKQIRLAYTKLTLLKAMADSLDMSIVLVKDVFDEITDCCVVI